jgi:hypothetical protein
MWCLVLTVVVSFETVAAKGEGTFEVYNVVSANARFRVRLTNRQTGRFVESPQVIGFKESWTVKLSGGEYRAQLFGRRLERDLGWIDVGKVEGGRILIGESNQHWTPRKIKSVDGSVRVEWSLAVAAPVNAPPPSIVARVEQDAQVEIALKVPVKQFRVPLGITFKMCPTGVHIETVAANSPAKRCVNEVSGGQDPLNEGDHVLAVNEIQPRSLEEMHNLVSKSPSQIRLRISDAKGLNVRTVTTELVK